MASHFVTLKCTLKTLIFCGFQGYCRPTQPEGQDIPEALAQLEAAPTSPRPVSQPRSASANHQEEKPGNHLPPITFAQTLNEQGKIFLFIFYIAIYRDVSLTT